MANRIFELKETKGTFQLKGIINGVNKDRFYTSKTTKTGKDFRAVNFGCAYDDKKSVYLSLNGMPQNNVYFSKRNNDGKTETKSIPWVNRNTFKEDGFRMIGINLGLTKTTDNKGNVVNDKKTMHAFDACDYIQAHLEDGMSTYMKGNIEFSSYQDNEGNVRRSIKYVPGQISMCQDVDFSAYDGADNKPVHDFTQNIVFMGIDKEKENDKETGRFIVSAKIVTYSDIVDTQFIVTDAKLAGLFKKNLKTYNALDVHGHIEVSHSVQEVSEDDCWGESNSMNSVAAPTKTEMIITGATPSTIDRETYTEKNIADAMKKIRNSKDADNKFADAKESTDNTDAWGETADDDDSNPWD